MPRKRASKIKDSGDILTKSAGSTKSRKPILKEDNELDEIFPDEDFNPKPKPKVSKLGKLNKSKFNRDLNELDYLLNESDERNRWDSIRTLLNIMRKDILEAKNNGNK